MGFLRCSNCDGEGVRFNGRWHDGTSKTYCDSCGMSSWARRREQKQPEIYWEVSKPQR